MAIEAFRNRLLVLDLLRSNGSVSRTELAALTGLGQATISGIVRSLVEAGVLEEERLTTKNPGRPRLALRLKGDSLLVCGVYIRPGILEMNVGRLDGQILYSATSANIPDPSAETISVAIVGLWEEACSDPALGGRIPSALGIGVPGMVDSHSGILHWLPPGTPKPAPLAEMVSRSIGVPVFIDNVGNMLGVSERWFGHEERFDDLCLVVVGVGVALAQYVDRTVHRGFNGFNPEFGHVKVGIGSDVSCICGGKGCLGAVAGTIGLTHQASAAFGWPEEMARDDGGTVARLATLARAGDVRARGLLDRSGEALGLALANHITMWDPGLVLVLVEDPDWIEEVAPVMRATIRSNLLPLLRDASEIEVRRPGAELFAQGGLALALEGLFRFSDLSSIRHPNRTQAGSRPPL